MKTLVGGIVGLAAIMAVAGCSRGTAVEPAAARSANAPGSTVGAEPLQPANNVPVSGPNGYSCSFPGANGQTILARFVIDGVNARDDEGTTFAVLSNSPTAVVLARARDDVAAPSGDVGAYLIAIDRRDLSMVQAAVGVKGSASTRKGRCIAG